MATNLVETVKKVIISLDLGYGNCNAVCGTKQFCFRTIIGSATLDETTAYKKGNPALPVWERINDMAVEVTEKVALPDGGTEEITQLYYLGQKALRDAKKGSATMFDSKSRYSVKEMQYIIRIAMDLLLEPNNEYDVILSLGLPIQQYASEKKEVIETVKNVIPNINLRWIGDGHTLNQEQYDKGLATPPKVNLLDVIVFPQAIFSVQSILFNSEGKPRLELYEGDKIAVVDIGFGTVDGCLFRITDSNGSYEVVQGTYVQTFKGVKELYAEVGKLLTKTFEVEFSDEDIQNFIDKGGMFRYRMKSYDLTKEYSDIKARLAKPIADEVKKVFEKEMANIGIVYLIGGGSVILEDEIKKQIPSLNVELFNPDDSKNGESAIFANAVGFYRSAKSYAQGVKNYEIYE